MPCPKSSTRSPRYGASCVGANFPAISSPCPAKTPAAIPGRCEAANPESRDSRFAPSRRPGMTTQHSQREVALPDAVVGLQLVDGGCVDDLALVDNRRVA